MITCEHQDGLELGGCGCTKLKKFKVGYNFCGILVEYIVPYFGDKNIYIPLN